MLTKDKIPFIDENSNMKKALKIITQKNLGTLVVINTKGLTVGLITDGQIRRATLEASDLHYIKVKNLMTKNPITVSEEILALKALSIMNENKITCLCVSHNKIKKKTEGIIHIHNILEKTTI